MARSLRVGIIGGGIGGLALAASLTKFGIEARIFERSSTLGEVGAGIQMTPNAVKIIRALGAWAELRRVSFRPQAIVGRNWRSGKEIFRTPLIEECSRLYGAEFLHVHRADVHRILHSLLPDGVTKLSMNCVEVTQTPDCAVARFEDGSEFDADIIVGADGIRSVVRRTLFGEDEPRFTGKMCWRTVVPVDRELSHIVSPDASFWLGPHGHVVTYYVRAGSLVNVVAIRDSADWTEESWNIPSNRDEMTGGFPGWHLNVLSLFARSTNVFKWGLFDRDPMPTWSSGRVTLLGDAAHPMLPFLSQGAAMAIEDAYVLARVLENAHDVARALVEYETLRLARTTRVQLESRKRGATYHTVSSVRQIYRDLIYTIRQMIEPHSSGLQARWVYSYDAVSLPLNTPWRPGEGSAGSVLARSIGHEAGRNVDKI